MAQPSPQGRLTSIDLPVYGRPVSPQTPTHSRLPVLCFPSLTQSASKQPAIHMQNPLASISWHSSPLILHFPRRILRKNPAPEQRMVSTNFYLANFKLDMLCEIDWLRESLFVNVHHIWRETGIQKYLQRGRFQHFTESEWERLFFAYLWELRIMLNHFYWGTLHGEKHFVTDMLQQLPPQVNKKFFTATVNSFQAKNVHNPRPRGNDWDLVWKRGCK